MSGKNKLKLSKEEIEKVESMQEFIFRTLDEAFLQNIPLKAIRELPTFYVYVCGAIAEFMMFAVFLYFIYTVYNQGVTSKFISLDLNSGDCQVIKKSVTGTFVADENGIWNGNPGYDYTRGFYSVIFTAASITLVEYAEILRLAGVQLHELSALAVTQDLASNLLIYMSWQFTCDVETNPLCLAFVGQTFAFSASSQYVFSLSYVDSTLSNAFADCSTVSLTSYDLANSVNVGQYNYAEFMANPSCSSTVNPMDLGYDPILNGETFQMVMDTRTMVDCLSINMNVLPTTALSAVGEAPVTTYVNNGYRYVGRYYTDSWYSGMRPLYCVDNIDYDPSKPSENMNNLCLITMGNVTGIPIFLHFGAGNFNGEAMANSPMPCECNTFGTFDACDVFNLMSGFMFFSGLTLAQTIDAWINITLNAGDSYNLNQLAYNASWASAASTYDPAVNPIIHDAAWRNSSYEFCRHSSLGTCSILIYNSYGDTVFDRSLSPSLFLVNNGSCAPQYTLAGDAYDQLIETVPTPVVESYYQCVLTPTTALTNAAGIASGNVAIIVPIILFMSLPFVYLWLKVTGNVMPKPEYEKTEKDTALDLMALQILRIRDNRVRGIRKEGYLINMAKELVKAASKADGGYVDSDDSEDSDDEPYPKSSIRNRSNPIRDRPSNLHSNTSSHSNSGPSPHMMSPGIASIPGMEIGPGVGGTITNSTPTPTVTPHVSQRRTSRHASELMFLQKRRPSLALSKLCGGDSDDEEGGTRGSLSTSSSAVTTQPGGINLSGGNSNAVIHDALFSNRDPVRSSVSGMELSSMKGRRYGDNDVEL